MSWGKVHNCYPKETFPTGSQRSKLDGVRYDLVSPFALQRLAATYAEGAAKFGDHNWRKGQPFSAVLNHVFNHITLYLAGDRSVDHLAHAAWGLFALMEQEETKPEMNDLFDFGEVELE